jgi:hypothetical protein
MSKCASSWSLAKVILRCTVSETSKLENLSFASMYVRVASHEGVFIDKGIFYKKNRCLNLYDRFTAVGPGSVVSIATPYGVEGRGIESR